MHEQPQSLLGHQKQVEESTPIVARLVSVQHYTTPHTHTPQLVNEWARVLRPVTCKPSVNFLVNTACESVLPRVAAVTTTDCSTKSAHQHTSNSLKSSRPYEQPACTLPLSVSPLPPLRPLEPPEPIPTTATNNERRTANDERRMTNDERRTTNDERRATNNERRTNDGNLHTLGTAYLTINIHGL